MSQPKCPDCGVILPCARFEHREGCSFSTPLTATPRDEQISALHAEITRLTAEREEFKSGYIPLIDAITKVVWGYDENEPLTVGSYGRDLLRVVERMKLERATIQVKLDESRREYDRVYTAAQIAWKFRDERNEAREERLAAEQQNDTLKRHLDAIAAALGLDKATYQPDQLPGMVTAIKTRE